MVLVPRVRGFLRTRIPPSFVGVGAERGGAMKRDRRRASQPKFPATARKGALSLQLWRWFRGWRPRLSALLFAGGASCAQTRRKFANQEGPRADAHSRRKQRPSAAPNGTADKRDVSGPGKTGMGNWIIFPAHAKTWKKPFLFSLFWGSWLFFGRRTFSSQSPDDPIPIYCLSLFSTAAGARKHGVRGGRNPGTYNP